MEKQINKEQMLEDILKEFSAQGELVNGLGDALQNIALAGHFDEQGQWQEPEWKKNVLFDVAQARALIKKLYLIGQYFFVFFIFFFAPYPCKWITLVIGGIGEDITGAARFLDRVR